MSQWSRWPLWVFSFDYPIVELWSEMCFQSHFGQLKKCNIFILLFNPMVTSCSHVFQAYSVINIMRYTSLIVRHLSWNCRKNNSTWLFKYSLLFKFFLYNGFWLCLMWCRHIESSHAKINLLHTFYRVQKYNLFPTKHSIDIFRPLEVKQCRLLPMGKIY